MKGIVYILVNPCLDGWVKIGMTNKDDIRERLASLNNPPNIPLPFRVYAEYHVEKPKEVEKSIHDIIDDLAPNLHASQITNNGRLRIREFFRMLPEKAFDIFKRVAKLRGDEDNLKLIIPSEEEQEQEAIVQASNRGSKLNLRELGIPPNAELTFFNDDKITCKVDIDKNKLIYNGDPYSISKLALKFLNEKCGWKAKSISGARYFKYNGIILDEIRKEKDSIATVED